MQTMPASGRGECSGNARAGGATNVKDCRCRAAADDSGRFASKIWNAKGLADAFSECVVSVTAAKLVL
jgi:hypothetical protein